MADNQIKVSDDTWRRLNARKEPGDTFEDVIQRLLGTVGDAAAEAAES